MKVNLLSAARAVFVLRQKAREINARLADAETALRAAARRSVTVVGPYTVARHVVHVAGYEVRPYAYVSLTVAKKLKGTLRMTDGTPVYLRTAQDKRPAGARRK